MLPIWTAHTFKVVCLYEDELGIIFVAPRALSVYIEDDQGIIVVAPGVAELPSPEI